MSTTSTQHGGEPAFPHNKELSDGSFSYHSGMTLRQFYKAHALAGMLASESTGEGMIPACKPEETWGIRTAERAAFFADAMLAEDAAFAERAKGPTP